MRLLLLSDLHLDCGDRLGAFGWEPAEFARTLEEVAEEHRAERIVLAGDVFELYRYKLKDVLEANAALMETLIARKAVFVRGNHDWTSPLGFDSFDMVNSRGQRIHVEHGHGADFINGTALGRALGILGFKVLLFFSGLPFVRYGFFKELERRERGLHKKHHRESLRYLEYGLSLLHEYDLVVLGHTHKMERHAADFKGRKRIYLNSGSCSLGRFEAILLDTETLEHEFIRKKPMKLGHGRPYAPHDVEA